MGVSLWQRISKMWRLYHHVEKSHMKDVKEIFETAIINGSCKYCNEYIGSNIHHIFETRDK